MHTVPKSWDISHLIPLKKWGNEERDQEVKLQNQNSRNNKPPPMKTFLTKIF